ncbi:helix-turn-helix domain-containing protein [Streptomyces alboniger]|uniref:XRE family transcriptional regulator n=1 Tax=Streptomyces alboniger TaxID=132473 RepID=A0A5J6HJL6_STRAD|nr:XRE family transcriptional regulator [Streptomyces alboniger]
MGGGRRAWGRVARRPGSATRVRRSRRPPGPAARARPPASAARAHPPPASAARARPSRPPFVPPLVLGCPCPPPIARIETGQQAPTLDSLIRIADVIGVPLRDIVYRRGSLSARRRAGCRSGRRQRVTLLLLLAWARARFLRYEVELTAFDTEGRALSAYVRGGRIRGEELA